MLINTISYSALMILLISLHEIENLFLFTAIKLTQREKAEITGLTPVRRDIYHFST